MINRSLFTTQGERTWLERNKSGPLGLVGESIEPTNSTSPRKEYNPYGGRAGNNESWRRNRNDEEDWRSSNNTNRGEKWSKLKKKIKIWISN
jgi:hypothetical protein